VYRRTENEMPAHPEEIAMAREEGVEFLFLATPKEVHGQDGISGIKLEKMALGEVDDSGRRRPTPTGETFDIDCDGMILAIGEGTRVDDLPPSISHRKGVVVTHAIGSGKRAAIAIDRFLQGHKAEDIALDQFKWGDRGNISVGLMKGITLFMRRNPSLEVIDYKNMNPFYFDHRPQIKNHRIPAKVRLKGFQELITSPSEQEAVSEARRCFMCGSCTECGNCYIFCPDSAIRRDPVGYGYIPDMDYCKGCGICVNECPRGAMKLKFME